MIKQPLWNIDCSAVDRTESRSYGGVHRTAITEAQRDETLLRFFREVAESYVNRGRMLAGGHLELSLRIVPWREV